MSKKSFARLIRIVTGTFGAEKDEAFSLDTSLTKVERFVHFWVLVTHSFIRNRCPVRAAALSYTTLLALIPMLAVAVGFTSLFYKSEGQEKIESLIEQFVERVVPVAVSDTNRAGHAQPEGNAWATEDAPERDTAEAATVGDTNLVLSAVDPDAAAASPTNALAAALTGEQGLAAQKQAASMIHGFIQNTYSGTLGVTGVVALLLTAIMMITSIENALNDIWGVSRGRNWFARIANYWTTITLGAMSLAAALLLASGPHLQHTRHLLQRVPYLEPLISEALPIVFTSLAFALLYWLLPNTKIHFRAALAGGFLAGTGWFFFNLFSFLLASRAVNWSKIYGSLALVPLFMFGLYVVWMIVLFGAQVAYAFQNRAVYLQEKLAENVNQRGREFVALRLMTCVGQRFQRGLPPATLREISGELGIPSRLAQQVLQTLFAARLVVEVNGAETAYSPARPLQAINCHHILLAMRALQGQELVTRDEPLRAEVYGEFARIQTAEKEAAARVTVLDLVDRAQARLAIRSPKEAADTGGDWRAPGTVSELPNEPVPTVAEPAPPATPVSRGAAADAPAAAELFADAKAEPARSPAQPTPEEDRSFPL